MYLLKRTDQGGGYVSKPGLKEAYTTNLDKVRIFTSKEDAERNRCIENEIIIPLSDLAERR